MRRSSNREENKRIIMDLDVVMKSHDCPYIVQCIGIFITTVSISLALIKKSGPLVKNKIVEIIFVHYHSSDHP